MTKNRVITCVIAQLEGAEDQAHRCRFLHELAAALVVEEEHTVTNQSLCATLLLSLLEECSPDAGNIVAAYEGRVGIGSAAVAVHLVVGHAVEGQQAQVEQAVVVVIRRRTTPPAAATNHERSRLDR